MNVVFSRKAIVVSNRLEEVQVWFVGVNVLCRPNVHWHLQGGQISRHDIPGRIGHQDQLIPALLQRFKRVDNFWKRLELSISIEYLKEVASNPCCWPKT